jgi:Ala-tRNA(Pro) deacylase
MEMKNIKDYLSNLEINFKEFLHQAVYTCEDAEKFVSGVRGPHLKNLFVKDKKSRRFYLAILPAEERLDMNSLGKALNDKIKFANEDDLKNFLGVNPGSVSPFGLINDLEHKIKLVVGRKIWDSDFVSFHPNANTETLELSGMDFQKYVKSLDNELVLIN